MSPGLSQFIFLAHDLVVIDDASLYACIIGVLLTLRQGMYALPADPFLPSHLSYVSSTGADETAFPQEKVSCARSQTLKRVPFGRMHKSLKDTVQIRARHLSSSRPYSHLTEVAPGPAQSSVESRTTALYGGGSSRGPGIALLPEGASLPLSPTPD